MSRQDFPGRSHAEWMLVLAPVVRVTLSGIWRFLEGGAHTRGPWDTPRLWSGSVYLTLCGLRVAGPVRSNILLTGSPEQWFPISGQKTLRVARPGPRRAPSSVTSPRPHPFIGSVCTRPAGVVRGPLMGLCPGPFPRLLLVRFSWRSATPLPATPPCPPTGAAGSRPGPRGTDHSRTCWSSSLGAPRSLSRLIPGVYGLVWGMGNVMGTFPPGYFPKGQSSQVGEGGPVPSLCGVYFPRVSVRPPPGLALSPGSFTEPVFRRPPSWFRHRPGWVQAGGCAPGPVSTDLDSLKRKQESLCQRYSIFNRSV